MTLFPSQPRDLVLPLPIGVESPSWPHFHSQQNAWTPTQPLLMWFLVLCRTDEARVGAHLQLFQPFGCPVALPSALGVAPEALGAGVGCRSRAGPSPGVMPPLCSPLACPCLMVGLGFSTKLFFSPPMVTKSIITGPPGER